MSGSTIGQAVPFLFIPILSKIYSPEQYYELGLVVTYSSIFAMISTLRLEYALLIPETLEEVNELASISLKSLFIVALSVVPILSFFHPFVFSLLVGFCTLIIGFGFFFIQYYNRLKRTKKIAINKTIVGPSISISQFLLKFSSFGLVLGKMLGDLIAITPFFSKDIVKLILGKTNFIENIKKYRNFPVITLPHALFGIVSNKAPLLLFGYLGFKSMSGEFEMVTRLGIAPITVITSSFYLIFSERFSNKARNKEKVTQLLKSNILLIGGLFGLPIIIVSYFAPTLLPLILGEKWANTGVFFQYLLPLILATLFTSPFVYIYQYFNKQWISLKLEILNSSLKIIGLVIGLQISPQFGILFFALGALIGYSIFMWNAYRLCLDFDSSLDK